MQVTYVANEGFLITTPRKKILIDALFGGFASDWCHVPPPDVVDRMTKAMPPFDRIDVVLVSHAHVDHFDAGLVSRHLQNNSQATLICPGQVADHLKAEARYQGLEHRVVEVTPEHGSGVQTIDAAGIAVQVWRLPHSPYYEDSAEGQLTHNKHENIQNLGFTFDLGHSRVFHGGDWEYGATHDTRNPLDEEQIDLAFLTPEAYLNLIAPENSAILHHRRPRNIVLMHLYPGGSLAVFTEQEQNALSETTVFKSSMESAHFAD